MYMKQLNLRTLCCLLAFIVASSFPSLAREKQNVSQVTSNVTISTEVDYHITGETPITTGGSINITNPEAWVFFNEIKPSDLLSTYTDKIKIDGKDFANNTNAMVSIYGHGSVVIPHGSNFYPLTVYTEPDFGGASNNDYKVGTYYKSLGNYDNTIKSFKLKRGYMATFANNSDGSGYSRVFIANDEDLEIPVLQPELRGKVSFIRIFRWQWPTKKGFCTYGNEYKQVNATWWYGWNASSNSTTDQEYTPQRHHESGNSYDGSKYYGAWPGWGEIDGRDANACHVLGNNEPDNIGDNKEVYLTVDQAVAGHPGLFASGMRIGCLATTSPNNYFYQFFDKCIAQGYRIDFVAVHCYWGNKSAQSWYNDLKYVHQRTGRPIWITEWNDGANWTEEYWPDQYIDENGNRRRPATPASQAHQLARIKEILNVLDTAYFIERYSIYNWVEDCRAMILHNELTPAGEYYANNKSQIAYKSAVGGSVITKPVFFKPSGLTSAYSANTNTVTLSWTSNNGELADSFAIERKKDKGSYEPIIVKPVTTIANSYKDVLASGDIGTFTYRVKEYGCDGKEYLTDEVIVSVAGTEGFDDFQYGRMKIGNNNYTYSFFMKPFEETPIVIAGPASNNNSNVPVCDHLYSIRTDRIQFRYFPWTTSNSNTTIARIDSTDFMALKRGSGYIENLPYEAATTLDKVGGEEYEVTFNQPFPEGVTPVVLATIQTAQTAAPFMHRIWDITNTGFKIRLYRQEGLNYDGVPKQTVNYFAIAPGNASLGEGKRIIATVLDKELGTSSYTITPGFDIRNSFFFAGLQSNNTDVGCILRYKTLSTGATGYALFKKIDSSSGKANSTITETVGYVIITDETPDGIESGATNNLENSLNIHPAVTTTTLYVNDNTATRVEIYSLLGIKMISQSIENNETTIDVSTLSAGNYIVRTNSGNSRIFIKK